MTPDHLITPPPELVSGWLAEQYGEPITPGEVSLHVAYRAARWGADQELEACIKLLSDLGGDGEMIRRCRRPKPLSLKEKGLNSLALLEAQGLCPELARDIRRALE